ncbi:glycosyltransferase [Pectobacterium brasiliense]|uniref:glycosyltransferase n=1 Tax=Pectobacterium brasiliense TaxID=180957 RepID=UPI00227A816C|nr:glycosyltransferase [Pectobacterium brasiliense]WGL29293.1 glycosyltransferase [Pectobacterium brasiliense]
MKYKVSVVMANYRTDEKLFFDSLNSILEQTYSNIEIIIVDDGSGDDYINDVYKKTEIFDNVKIIKNSRNCGLAAALNTGIKNASGEFIARMDTDDFSYPQRIEKQVNFLLEHPEIDVVGSYARKIGDESSIIKVPISSKDCYVRSFFNSPFVHPTVLIRRAFFEEVGFYNESYIKAQDYELWSRGLLKNKKYGNIPEILLNYKIYSKSKMNSKVLEQIKFTKHIRRNLILSLGVAKSELISAHDYLSHIIADDAVPKKIDLKFLFSDVYSKLYAISNVRLKRELLRRVLATMKYKYNVMPLLYYIFYSFIGWK